MRNSIPLLLATVRPRLGDIARWVKKSRALVANWAEGRNQPQPEDRALLVKAIRDHAESLLLLAKKVEVEGNRQGHLRLLDTDTEE